MTKEFVNVVLTADNAYANIVGVCMVSILENLSADRKCRFFIFSYKFSDENISDINKLKLKYDCEIIYIKMEDYIPRFNFINENSFKNKWISIVCYFRILLFDILPNYVEKCFYVDGDIIVDCDLSQIKIEKDKIFVACPEAHAMQFRKRILKHCYKLPEFEKFKKNPIENTYFNAGFFLVDIKKSKELRIYEQLINLLKKYPKLPYCDQDLLNMVFGQKYRDYIQYLPPEYNVFTLINYKYNYNNTSFNIEELRKAFKFPKIIHYAGAQKPWNSFRIIHHRNIWWKYFDKSPWKINCFGKIKMFMKNFLSVNKNKCIRYAKYILYIIKNTK